MPVTVPSRKDPRPAHSVTVPSRPKNPKDSTQRSQSQHLLHQRIQSNAKNCLQQYLLHQRPSIRSIDSVAINITFITKRPRARTELSATAPSAPKDPQTMAATVPSTPKGTNASAVIHQTCKNTGSEHLEERPATNIMQKGSNETEGSRET